ncbi:hypothetical protein [Planococcus lenghuensis]|uniref:Uncharacterized protein n=1 Tax=Planococcus lenghuensis TaxID=2213202 RepID=A0A1Q2L4F9_9BACL|nr:hypothetical protein [Planococcus lenghuensis]AQQ55301.1 hypothetical protein B0X71_19175 [Planococcus lenghuensis]
MLLPATDLGLINSHLSSHDGLIKKVEKQLEQVEHPVLTELLKGKLELLHNHVKVMMEIIDPNKTDYTEVPPVKVLNESLKEKDLKTKSDLEIHLALEVKTSTQSMSIDNFFSALKMKTPKVKQTHIEMALQQVKLTNSLIEFLKENKAEVMPFSSQEEQQKVLDHFAHMRNE